MVGVQWALHEADGQPFILICNGDMIEGDHHGTKEIWSKDIGDHSEAAFRTLDKLAKHAAKTYMVRGTESHTGEHELSVAHRLKAQPNPETGHPIFEILKLRINGTNVSVRHHFPATSRVHLEASQHSIQLNNAILEAHRAGERPPQVIVGAHRHRPGHWSDGTHMSVVTGAWQAQTRFTYKAVPDARPAPRNYFLHFDEPGRPPRLSYFQPKARPSRVITP